MRADDPRVYVKRKDSQCWHTQWEDDTIYLIVGPYASDQALDPASDNFGVPLQRLIDLRASQIVEKGGCIA